MRMSNAMMQLKEIATIAPVERAAAMATVLQESVGPTARSQAWDALSDRACSLYLLALAGDKGDRRGAGSGMEMGPGQQQDSVTPSGHSQLCPGLHHTTTEAFSAFPFRRQGSEDTGITVLPPAPGREKVTVGMKGQAVRAPQDGLWGCQRTATKGSTELRWSSKATAATRSGAVLGIFPAPFSSPSSAPHPLREPPS